MPNQFSLRSFLAVVFLLGCTFTMMRPARATSTLSIANTTAVAGATNSPNAVFTVTLSPAASSTVTVQYATANGTASAGTDYTSTSGTLTFPAGSTSATFNVSIAYGVTDASGLTFAANLSSATNATISASSGTCTITHDTGAATMSVSPGSQTTVVNQAATITVTYTPPYGISTINSAAANFGNNSGPTTSLYAKYSASGGDLLYLENSSGTWVGGYAPGSSHVITTSLGSLNCAQTTVTQSGGNLVVAWNITPASGLVAANSVYAYLSDTYGANSGYVNEGSWTVFPQPAVVNHSNYVVENNSVTASAPGVLASATTNGLTLTAAKVTNPSHGAVTVNGDGSYTYTPTPGYSGIDTFTYDASDTNLTVSNTATITITVDAPPTVVSCSPSSQPTLVGQAATFTVVYNLPAGPSYINEVGACFGHLSTPATSLYAKYQYNTGLLYLANSSGTYIGGYAPGSSNVITTSLGTLNCAQTIESLSGNQVTISWNITPTSSLDGSNAVDLNDSDNYGGSSGWIDDASWTVGSAPTATSASYPVLNGTPKAITLAGTDPNGYALSYAVSGNPSHGTVSPTGANVTYTPTGTYAGSDAFTFTVTDTGGFTASAVISLTVLPAPVAVNDGYSLNEGTTLTESAPGVLANDNGNGLTLTASRVTNAAHGNASLNSDGSFTYTPTGTFYGSDSFTYAVTDSNGIVSNTATVSLTVYAPPVATAASYTVLSGTPTSITLTGTDPNGLTLGTYTVLTQPADGTLPPTAPNLTYTPAGTFAGTDSFTFKVNDGIQDSAPATISLTVLPAPVAENQSYNMISGTTLTEAAPGVLSGADGYGLTLTAHLVTNVAYGTLNLGGNGGFTYTPSSTGFYGTDSFTYDVVDSNNVVSAPATVTLDVISPPDDQGDSFAVAENSTLTNPPNNAEGIGLQGDAWDPQGFPLTFALVTDGSNGHALVNPDGTFTYTPNPNYLGNDSFTFQVSNGFALSNVATVDLAVDPIPAAANLSFYVQENRQLVLPGAGLLQGATENPNNGPFHLFQIDGSYGSADNGDGTLKLNDSGNDEFDAENNFVGTTTFTFTIADVNGMQSPPATATFYVLAPPVANNISVIAPYQTPTAVNLSGVDPGGWPLTYQVVTQPPGGTFTGSGANLIYTPNPGFVGADTFTYQVSDVAGPSQLVRGTITVLPPPQANPDEFFVGPGQTLTVPGPGVLANDTASTPTMTAFKVSTTSNGQLDLAADGGFTYTPTTPGFSGQDSFTYSAVDAYGVHSAPTTVTISVQSGPVATNDSYLADENIPLVVGNPAAGVLANDYDPEDLVLSAQLVSQAQHGSVNLNEDGTFEYTPKDGYSGPDSFTYLASDDELDSNVATVNICVGSSWLGPVAEPGNCATPENSALTAAVSVYNPYQDTLTYTVPVQVVHGAPVTVNPDGSFTYTPAAGFAGTDSFTFQIADPYGNISSAVETINVNSTLQGATALPQTVTTPLNTVVAFTLTGTTPDGLPLSFNVVRNPVWGALGGTAPNLTYTPKSGFTGDDSLQFTVSDTATGTSTPATVTIIVLPPPVASDEAYSTEENTILTVAAPGPLADAQDNGLPLTAALDEDAVDGHACVNPDGSLTYTPAEGFVGVDAFTFTVTDSNGITSAPATVTVTVNPTYVPPVAQSQTVSVPYEQGTDFVLGATAMPNATLTYSLLTQPANGTLEGEAPYYTYTPNSNPPGPGFSGTDSLTFQVNDGTSNSNVATITFNVSGPVPIASDDYYEGAENAMLTVPAGSGVLVNDNGFGLGLTALISTQATNGTANVGLDGSFTYLPYTGFTGYDSFTYTAVDANGNVSLPATVTIFVDSPPVASDESVYVPGNTPTAITLSAIDPDGDALTYSLVTLPANGTIPPITGPNLVYTPNPGFSGQDSFTYQVSDGVMTSNVATVTITVGSDEPVTAIEDDYAVNENDILSETASNGVLSNDLGDAQPLTAQKVADAQNGDLTLNPDGSFTYIPYPGFYGTDSFSYTATDADGNVSLPANVIITVNGAPTADDQSVDVAPGTPTEIFLYAQDPEGLSLTYTCSQPPNGSFTGTAPDLIYTPNSGFTGTDSFTFQASDVNLSSNTATVTITVAPPGPIASDENYFTNENTTLTVAAPGPLADADGNGLTLTAAKATDPANGTLDMNSDGSFTYTPAPGFSGLDTFTYTVTDSNGNTSPPATAVVTVNFVAEPPVATSSTVNVSLNQPAWFTLQANDPDGNALTYHVLSLPAYGKLSGEAPYLTYTPNSGSVASDSLTFQVNNGFATSDVATVTFQMSSPNAIDLQIQNQGDTGYQGVNIFNATAANEQCNQSKQGGTAAVYLVNVHNAAGGGNVPARLLASATPEFWTVQYVDVTAGNTDVTSQITGTGYAFALGATDEVIEEQVTPPLGLAQETVFPALITACRSDDSSNTVIDAVQANTDATVGLPNTPILVTIGDFQGYPGPSGLCPFNFAVSLSSPSNVETVVDFATADGTAIAGTDYIANSGILTIPAGSTSATITVLVYGTTLHTANKKFVVNLSNPVNANLATTSIGTGTILLEPSVSIAGSEQFFFAPGTSVCDFPVTLSNVSCVNTTVSYATADGTAIAGTDYTAASGTLVIPAGSTTGNIPVTVFGGLAGANASRQFTVTLSDPVNANLGVSVANGTITDVTYPPAPTGGGGGGGGGDTVEPVNNPIDYLPSVSAVLTYNECISVPVTLVNVDSTPQSYLVTVPANAGHDGGAVTTVIGAGIGPVPATPNVYTVTVPANSSFTFSFTVMFPHAPYFTPDAFQSVKPECVKVKIQAYDSNSNPVGNPEELDCQFTIQTLSAIEWSLDGVNWYVATGASLVVPQYTVVRLAAIGSSNAIWPDNNLTMRPQWFQNTLGPVPGPVWGPLPGQECPFLMDTVGAQSITCACGNTLGVTVQTVPGSAQ